MKQFLLEVFTWWNGATLGTRFYTWRFGTFVGEDELGNRYYRGNVPPHGERRWVIYSGTVEASMIPSGWHGWIHFTTDISPADEDYVAPEWQQPHRPNLTGTPSAYRPKGSTLGRKRTVVPDYQAWTPRN